MSAMPLDRELGSSPTPPWGITQTYEQISVPKLSPERLARVATPLPETSISIAQCNVLRHATYAHYAGENKVEPVDMGVRAESFYRLASYAADIVCLQEWSPLADEEPHYRPNRLGEFRDTHTVIEEHLGGRAGAAIAYDATKFSLVATQFAHWGGMKGCCVALLQDRRVLASHPASLDAAFIGVASLHCSFGKGKAAAELAKAVALIRGHYHFARCARWLLCGDFNTDAKQQLLETLGPTWTEANEANVPTHRSGRDAHVQYDHIFYTTPQLGLVDFAVQPQQFDQLISHHVDQRRDSPPPFFSDHAILRATFLRE